MLHDNRHIGFKHRRIGRVAWNRPRIFEIVEAQMQRAARGNRDPIGTDGLAIGEKDG